MILVDTSVWIDYFRGVANPQSDCLDTLLGREPVAVGDLIPAEDLQGFTTDSAFAQALKLMKAVEQIDRRPSDRSGGGTELPNVTVSGRHRQKDHIDTLIATRCIHDGMPLLYGDRDFDPFAEHLGLIPALNLEGPRG